MSKKKKNDRGKEFRQDQEPSLFPNKEIIKLHQELFGHIAKYHHVADVSDLPVELGRCFTSTHII